MKNVLQFQKKKLLLTCHQNDVTMSNENLKIKAVKVPGFRIELSVNVKGQPVARFYKLMTSGKNKGGVKMLNGFYFTNEAARTKWVIEKLEFLASERKAKADLVARNQAARAQMVNPYKVGQVVYESWGYDQTNIDFYQVIEVKEKSVVLMGIDSQLVPEQPRGYSPMSGFVMPVAGQFNGKSFLKPVNFSLNQAGELNYYLPGVHRGILSIYDKAENGVYSSWYA